MKQKKLNEQNLGFEGQTKSFRGPHSALGFCVENALEHSLLIVINRNKIMTSLKTTPLAVISGQKRTRKRQRQKDSEDRENRPEETDQVRI